MSKFVPLKTTLHDWCQHIELSEAQEQNVLAALNLTEQNAFQAGAKAMRDKLVDESWKRADKGYGAINSYDIEKVYSDVCKGDS